MKKWKPWKPWKPLREFRGTECLPPRMKLPKEGDLDSVLDERQIARQHRQTQLKQTLRTLRDENRGGEAVEHQRVDRLLHTIPRGIPNFGGFGRECRGEVAPARYLCVIPAGRIYRWFPWWAFLSLKRKSRWS